MPRFVTFFTTGSEYEQEAVELRKTTDAHGIHLHVREFPSQGSWALNTQLKAQLIEQCLFDSPEPLVYVDSDARVLQRPVLFTTLADSCDIAVHYRPDKRFAHGRELLSGTMYFSNTPRSQALVAAWRARNLEQPGNMDQRTLQQVIDERLVDGLRVYELPPTYTKIFDIMRNVGPGVIEHYQASRRLRRTIT